MESSDAFSKRVQVLRALARSQPTNTPQYTNVVSIARQRANMPSRAVRPLLLLLLPATALAQGGHLAHSDGFVPYAGYAGPLQVGGTVGPVNSNATAYMSQTFAYALTGVDPACANGAGSAANSCGIHVHAGTSCSEGAGAHYFAPFGAPDPWAHIAYESTCGSSGIGSTCVSWRASGSFVLDTGMTTQELGGHAFIVHDRGGGRVGCALVSTHHEYVRDDDAQVIGTSIGVCTAFILLAACVACLRRDRNPAAPPPVSSVQHTEQIADLRELGVV